MAGSKGRFMVEGNRLVVTDKFDPRFQPDSESELLQTLSGILREGKDSDTVILDMRATDNLPSMVIGLIVEAHRHVTENGKSLHIIIRPEHFRNLQSSGIEKYFVKIGEHTEEDGSEYFEFASKIGEE